MKAFLRALGREINFFAIQPALNAELEQRDSCKVISKPEKKFAFHVAYKNPSEDSVSWMSFHHSPKKAKKKFFFHHWRIRRWKKYDQIRGEASRLLDWNLIYSPFAVFVFVRVRLNAVLFD